MITSCAVLDAVVEEKRSGAEVAGSALLVEAEADDADWVEAGYGEYDEDEAVVENSAGRCLACTSVIRRACRA